MYGTDIDFVIWIGTIGFIFMVVGMVLEMVFEPR